jgi:hypothetical protein
MRAWMRFIAVAACPLLSGCLLSRNAVTLPQDDVLVRDQLVIHCDFQLPQRHRLVEELVARRGDVIEDLQLPVSDEPINVYLFESPDRLRDYIAQEHPEFPQRRAFFLEGDTRLDVFAYWGDRVAEDLRHEVTHGYLHTMVPYLPLWLDEGLAEFYEVPRGQNGLNPPHVNLLLRADREQGWQPNLAKLEQITQPADMTQQHYAESWAWIHFLLTTTPERRQLLRGHLSRVRMTGTAPPLSQVLEAAEPQSAAKLREHLLSLRPAGPTVP